MNIHGLKFLVNEDQSLIQYLDIHLQRRLYRVVTFKVTQGSRFDQDDLKAVAWSFKIRTMSVTTILKSMA